jgi:hypothetical protein
VQRREVVGFAAHVAVLAADHPERRVGELAPDHRRRVREREPERLREQCVAREERSRLVEGDVSRGAAAPLVVVVHRGQVVVDEGERVHELDGRRCGQAVLCDRTGRLGDRKREDRANALAARLERIPQSFFETAELRCEGKLGEVALD